MHRLLTTTIAATALCTTLAACTVAEPRPGVYVPAGVVYVAPDYDVPGPGYYWDYNVGIGWGWWHPRHGWHRR